MTEKQEGAPEEDQPPMTKKMHLDEGTFEPVVKEGEIPMVPTEEEIRKHPELEYTNEEVRQVVAQMSAEDRIQFKEFEQYFLTCYQQTGNIRRLSQEVRAIVKEMCPLMPGQLQEAVVKARAQLLLEARLKEICQNLNIPLPAIISPQAIHPVDEALLGKNTKSTEESEEDETHVVSTLETQKETKLEESAGLSHKITPVLVKQEDVKPTQLLATQYSPDIKFQAMEGEGDDSLRIIRVVKGHDLCYDLTKDDDELKEACALVTEDLLPSHHDKVEADDLSVVSVEMYDSIDVREAKELLIKLAETKTKEAEILRELTVVVSADDLTPRQVGEITKGVVEQEVVLPEVKFITDKYDYQATRMILAAGH